MTPSTAGERAARLRVTFYGNAIDELEREAHASLAVHPADPVALAYLARALFKEGRFAEARGVLDEIPEAHVEGLIARADYLDYVGDAAGAGVAYRQALAREPNDLDALLGLAAVLTLQEDVREAERAVLAAAPGVPREEPCQQARLRVLQGAIAGLKAGRGGLFEKLRWGPGVLHAFEQARRLCPRSPYPPYALGRFYLEAPGALGGGLPNAIAAFRAAIALDPFYHRARAALIAALADAGYADDARQELADYRHDFAGLPHALGAVERIRP